MRELSGFWITGIIFNLTVVTLAFIWLFKITRKPDDKKKDSDKVQ